MKRWIAPTGIVFGSLALFAVIGIGAWGIFRKKMAGIEAAMAAPPPPEAPEAVTLTKVESLSYRQSVTSIGTVRAPRWITLRNEVPGRIVELRLSDGQIVEEGEVLIELDHTVEDAQLKSAQARRRLAQSVYDRAREAAKANASSGSELDQTEGELAQASAEIERLEAVIAKKTLRAPFRARVGLIEKYVGQYLMEGVDITNLQGIDSYSYVDFMMPEGVADAIELGQTVELLFGPESLKAELIAVEAMADRATRNLMGRARVEQPPPALQPNDSVKVQIEFGPQMDVLGVPSVAMRRAPTGAYVFIAEPDDQGKLRAHQRSVQPGRAIGPLTSVLDGLKPSDVVVADGSFKLRDGVLLAEMPGITSSGSPSNPNESAPATHEQSEPTANDPASLTSAESN